MIGPQRSRVIILSLILTGLAAALGQELTSPTDTQQPAPAATTDAPARAAASNAEPVNQRDQWLSEILARPLFSPDRRPPANMPRAMAGLPRLTAIIVQASQRTAIFAASAGLRPLVVGQGSQIGAYTVRDIADTSITVAGPQGLSVIRPSFDTTAPIAEPPAAQKMALPAFFKVPPQ